MAFFTLDSATRGDRTTVTRRGDGSGPRSIHTLRLRAACFDLALMGLAAACGRSSPTAPENAAPTVTVAFVGPSACTAEPGAPCTLDVIANASDPDGDALQFTWSGCAAGTSPRATCKVERPGEVVASVEVNDGHGHAVRASVTGQGQAIPNRPPTVTVAFERESTCELRPGKSSCIVDVVAQATDPDGDPLRYLWSGCTSGTKSEAACEIDRVGPVAASVEVSDDQGHSVSASVTAIGREMKNRPPIVSVAFDGPSACAPLPWKPCTLTVTAQATDPDGDPVQLAWSGCAGGTSPRAACTVDRPGAVPATVSVIDAQGLTASGTLTATGSNHGPEVRVGPPVGAFPSGSFVMSGNLWDPEEGLICNRGDGFCVSLTATGACAPLGLECSCLAGVEAFFRPTSPSGLCTVVVTARDSWGALGSTTVRFDVANPPK